MHQTSAPKTISSGEGGAARNGAMLDRWVQEEFRDGPYHVIAFIARQSATSRDGKPTNGS
jgi:hypothetical protein